jgi:hypothetical protein
VKTPEERTEALRQQVNSKIRWGARDGEVIDWLAEKHGITGDEADGLLAEAHRIRRAAVRTKAIIMLVTSAAGIAMAGVFIGLQVQAGVFVIGRGSVLILGIGIFSLGVFLRNLWRLVSGQNLGSVD